VTASARFAVNPPPLLSLGRTSASDLLLTWNNPYFVLQSAPALDAPWQTLTNTSPFLFSSNTVVGTPAQFYRLLRQ
jgi:hypothetical protein